MLHDSAIMQMLFAERGNLDSVKHSNEHQEAVGIFCDKYDAFRKKYADDSKLLALFDDVCEAHDEDQATAEEDFYREGFSFGVLMGIDIMRVNSKKD